MSYRQIFLFRCLFIISLIAVVYLALVVYLAFAPVDHTMIGRINDKTSHVFAFFMLALLADFSFPGKDFGWYKILPLILFGLVVEIMQYFLQLGIFSLFDLLADVLGLILYTFSYPLLKRLPFIQLRWR